MSRAIRFAGLAALLPVGVAYGATLVHAGRLIDGVSSAPRARVSFVMKDGVIHKR
jgi:hypothetical protein